MVRGFTETSLTVDSVDDVLAKMTSEAIADQVHFCEDITTLVILINKCNEILQFEGFGYWTHGHLNHHEISAIVGKAEGRIDRLRGAKTVMMRARDPKIHAEIYYRQEVGYNGPQKSEDRPGSTTGRKKRGSRSID